jgi:predicted negative regulator of RcsB-dependent stress response
MTSAPSSEPQGKDPKTGGAASPLSAATTAVGFEEAVHQFWEKNRQQIVWVCVAVLLFMVGKEAWERIAAMRERNRQEEFTQAASSPAKLAAFADANRGHALGGVAHLMLADQRFESGEFKQAAISYQQAKGLLTLPALIGRARLGEAVSNLNAGDRAAGETALKAIAADTALLKVTRSEASYHLASLAAEAGRGDDVKKLVEEISKLDPASTWSQRATLLLANLPAEAKPAEAASKPAVSFKPGGK